MKFDVERGLISKLLQTKDIMTVKDCQIKSHFFTGDNREVYNYIYESVLSTGDMPTVRVIKRAFRDILWRK